MKKVGGHSISRIRTFEGDVATVRGVESPKKEDDSKLESVISETPTPQTTIQNSADKILKEEIPQATNFIATDLKTTSKTPAKTPQPTVLPTKTSNASQPEEIKIPRVKKKMPDLQDAVGSIKTNQSKSTLSVEDAVYDVSNNDLEEGTLVSNKRKNSFNLFAAIGSAFHSWFSDTATQIATPKVPQQTMSKAESRIETITKAARASNHAPKSDHGVVIKRLTKTKRKKQQGGLSIKSKSTVTAPQWSSSQEEADSVLPAEPIDSISSLELETEIPTPVEVPIPTEEIVDVVEEEAIPLEPLATPEEIQAQEEEELARAIAWEQAKVAPEPEIVQAKVSIPEPVPQKKRVYRAAPTQESGVPIYIYTLIIIGASLLGIGVSVYWFTSSTPNEEAIILRIPSLFLATETVPVTLGSSRADTLSTILDASLTTRETIQIYPTVTDITGHATPVDAQTILTSLAWRAPGSFTRSITDMTFGSHNGTELFILMKVTNFDTAFGGILSWEPDMSEDLSPLFGLPVTQSYDPYARTDTQVRSAFFKDTIVGNRSARMLVDAQETQRLMYAFVNPNLILITPNAETFNAILPLVIQ